MKYFKKIVGKRIYLSPINVEDVEQYTKWMNDYEVNKGLDQNVNVISIPVEQEFLAKKCREKYHFAIINMEDDKLIGGISLTDVDFVDKTAELGVFIGEESYRSNGYGSEAIMLILDYGFNQVNLNNIMLTVYSFNKRAQKAYEKCGFKVFGVWENAHYFDGTYCDEIFMNIIKDDFNKKKN